MAKGTNAYRYKLIRNANTIESAVENFIDAYTELREEIKAIETGVAFIKNTKDRDAESNFSYGCTDCSSFPKDACNYCWH